MTARTRPDSKIPLNLPERPYQIARTWFRSMRLESPHVIPTRFDFLGKYLTPILVAGSGRSGTTMLMALLGTDPRVAFDRVYPFENRYLTYLAKFAVLSG